MQEILLNKTLILSIESHDQKVRLIVLESGAELACRKETLSKVKNFLALEEGNIFKGRLQLSKHGDVIEIIVKNKSIAVVATSVFGQAIDNLA